MDTTTLAVIGVIVLALIIAMVAMGRRSTLAGRPALKPVTPEAHDRYVTRWDQVESHFVEAPQEAVAEADALVLALLGEREHPLAENMLPEGVRKRREAALKRCGWPFCTTALWWKRWPGCPWTASKFARGAGKPPRRGQSRRSRPAAPVQSALQVTMHCGPGCPLTSMMMVKLSTVVNVGASKIVVPSGRLSEPLPVACENAPFS